MNERIKSLLAKAHLDVIEDLGDIDSNHVAEKFAELIIRECSGIADTYAKGGAGSEFDVGYMLCAQTLSVEIKQHFGVE